MEGIEMVFGNIILNTCAGKKNPGRVSMFIKHEGGFIITLNRDGSRSRYYSSEQKKDGFLKVIGNIDFYEWDSLIEEDKEA